MGGSTAPKRRATVDFDDWFDQFGTDTLASTPVRLLMRLAWLTGAQSVTDEVREELREAGR